MAFAEHEPLGDERLAAIMEQLATLNANFYNANRGRKSKARKPDDFLPAVGRAWEVPATEERTASGRRAKTPEQLRALFSAFAQAHNARTKGGKGKTAWRDE